MAWLRNQLQATGREHSKIGPEIREFLFLKLPYLDNKSSTDTSGIPEEGLQQFFKTEYFSQNRNTPSQKNGLCGPKKSQISLKQAEEHKTSQLTHQIVINFTLKSSSFSHHKNVKTLRTVKSACSGTCLRTRKVPLFGEKYSTVRLIKSL